MDKASIETVRLLLTVAPEVFRGGVFAMKGGTALNLFVHDMPRLSVDIDLAYPAWTTPRDEALRAIAGEFASIAQRLERLDLDVRTIGAAGLGESKLLIERPGALVKVEVNLVFRGTVQPVEHRSSPNAQRSHESKAAPLRGRCSTDPTQRPTISRKQSGPFTGPLQRSKMEPGGFEPPCQDVLDAASTRVVRPCSRSRPGGRTAQAGNKACEVLDPPRHASPLDPAR